jgi:hypothetical protein
MKTLPLLALLLPACGLFTPVAKSPCEGLYCLGVEVAQVPGAALVCYQTEQERTNARIRLMAQGCALGVDAEQRQRAVCPRAVTP